MADPAGLELTVPLALGLNLSGSHVLVSGSARSGLIVDITMVPADFVVISSATAAATTFPLILGLNLGGNYSTTSGTFSVPIVMRDATLAASGSGADIGITHPLAMGLVLGTSGSSTYAITSGTVAVPITFTPGTLTVTAEPAAINTTFPLSLGMLLVSQDYLLTSGTMSVPIAIADADPSEIDVPELAIGRGVAGRARLQRQPRFEAQFEPMLDMPLMPQPIDLREVELMLGVLFEVGVFNG